MTGAGLAACGGTSGLILGEVALPDASALDAGATLGAGPEPGEDAGDDAGCSTCASSVVVTGQSPTDQQGGTTGTAFTDTCPGNQAVIGYQGFLTDPSVGAILVGGVQAVCGVLSLGGPLPTQLTTSTGATLPMRGSAQSSPWTQMCPADQIVVGFSGSSGADLDQVAFVCAPWIASIGATGETLSMGTTVTLTPAGGDGGTPYAEVACPTGQLARGTNSRSGDWVDAFGLVCGTPTLASGDGGM
jgi:hypothetical protein